MSPRPLPALVAAAALLLAGCTGGSATPGPEPRAAASDTPGPAFSYVALGDSFTAAPGIPETDGSDGCLRSSGNYPSLVAEQLGEDREVELDDRSCSGADTSSLAGPQAIGREPRPPQLDALGRDTDLVTLSIGGNDFGVFLRLVGGCVSLAAQDPDGAPCRAASRGQGDLLADTQGQIERRLVRAIEEHVGELNAGLGRWESIKRFSVLERNLTVEGGDLTPSLKLKRRAVEERYAAVLGGLYDT